MPICILYTKKNQSNSDSQYSIYQEGFPKDVRIFEHLQEIQIEMLAVKLFTVETRHSHIINQYLVLGWNKRNKHVLIAF